MAKRMIEGIEIEISSGNVFADLGLADAEKLKIKSGLVIAIGGKTLAISVLPGLAAIGVGFIAGIGLLT